MDELHPRPTSLQGFTITGQLAQGRHTQVYLGQDADGVPVAIKVLNPGPAKDRLERRRFTRGIDAARRLNSTRTAAVLAADTQAPLPWVATEYLVGPTLAQRIAQDGPMAEPEALSMVADLAEGLQTMHAAGVLHGRVDGAAWPGGTHQHRPHLRRGPAHRYR